MSDTPRTEAEVARTDSCPMAGVVTVDANFACQLERELNAANDEMSKQARILLETVKDRNRLGVQLDLLRDELIRIRARIVESGLGDNPYLSNIFAYCERAQEDIAVNYTPIQEREKLQRELNAANARIKRLEEAGDKMASAWDKEWLTEADIEAIIDDWRKANEAKP